MIKSVSLFYIHNTYAPTRPETVYLSSYFAADSLSRVLSCYPILSRRSNRVPHAIVTADTNRKQLARDNVRTSLHSYQSQKQHSENRTDLPPLSAGFVLLVEFFSRLFECPVMVDPPNPLHCHIIRQRQLPLPLAGLAVSQCTTTVTGHKR
jgi:hypothetical protein